LQALRAANHDDVLMMRMKEKGRVESAMGVEKEKKLMSGVEVQNDRDGLGRKEMRARDAGW
jgi:hypothetical protein